LTTFELNKQSTDLSKQMMCGFTNVSQQLNDAKYEALKNKEKLYAQAASNFAASQLDSYKNKAELAMQVADVKFEASKTKDHLSRQMDECCCELKMLSSKEACDIQQKIDAKSSEQKELTRALDENRVRDALRDSTTENAFLKLAAFADDGYDGYGYGGRGRRKRGYVNENENHIYVDGHGKGRHGSHKGRDDESSYGSRRRSGSGSD
jgi:hypothetical protein